MIEKSSIRSIHKIYKIYLPHHFRYLSSDSNNNNESVVDIASNTPDFCIKIHQDDSTYANETKCIEKVLNSLNSEEKKNFFALKCLKYSSIDSFDVNSISLSNIDTISQCSEEIIKISFLF